MVYNYACTFSYDLPDASSTDQTQQLTRTLVQQPLCDVVSNRALLRGPDIMLHELGRDEQ